MGVDPIPGTYTMSLGNGRGQIQLVVEMGTYPEESRLERWMTVTVTHAEHLPKMDTVGASDPVCKVKVIYDDGTNTSRCTPCVPNSLDPSWNETFTFVQGTLSSFEGTLTSAGLYDLYQEDPGHLFTIFTGESPSDGKASISRQKSFTPGGNGIFGTSPLERKTVRRSRHEAAKRLSTTLKDGLHRPESGSTRTTLRSADSSAADPTAVSKTMSTDLAFREVPEETTVQATGLEYSAASER